MSLTRKMLKAMELDDDKTSQIFEAHQETINEISKERDELKEKLDKATADVERLSNVEKELVKAKAKLEEAKETEQEFTKLKKEYETFKADVEEKAVISNKSKAYKALLTKQGIPEKYQDAILKVTDLGTIELKDGKIVNEKELVESIDTEWSTFKVTESRQGANTPNPPNSNGGNTFEKMSLADKMAYANEHPDDEVVKAYLK